MASRTFAGLDYQWAVEELRNHENSEQDQLYAHDLQAIVTQFREYTSGQPTATPRQMPKYLIETVWKMRRLNAKPVLEGWATFFAAIASSRKPIASGCPRFSAFQAACCPNVDKGGRAASFSLWTASHFATWFDVSNASRTAS